MSQVSWVVEGTIPEGKFEELKSLSSEMSAATQANEPGTLRYEWFIDPERTIVYLYELYTDSAAAMVHLKTFGETFAQRFEQAVRVERVSVYGDASDEVLKTLGEEGVVMMVEMNGFAR